MLRACLRPAAVRAGGSTVNGVLQTAGCTYGKHHAAAKSGQLKYSALAGSRNTLKSTMRPPISGLARHSIRCRRRGDVGRTGFSKTSIVTNPHLAP
jgi:hypothetical protein